MLKVLFGGVSAWLSWLILYLQVPGSHIGASLCPAAPQLTIWVSLKLLQRQSTSPASSLPTCLV